MEYKYNDKIYSKERYFGDGDSINELLFKLEENEDITKTTITVYTIHGTTEPYTDDDINELLDDLVEYEIINREI